MEALRQNVEQEAPDELAGRQRHQMKHRPMNVSERDVLVPFEKLLGLLGIPFCAANPS
jgi:hypothetical protein